MESPEPALVPLSEHELALVVHSLHDLVDKVESWRNQKKFWFFSNNEAFRQIAQERVSEIKARIQRLDEGKSANHNK